MQSSNGFSLSRRRLLAGASLAAGASALGRPGSALAKAPMGMPQAPYFYRFKVGNAECTIVSDGILPLGDPDKSFINITHEEIQKELSENFLPTTDAILEQNALIVNFGDRVVLFDTGMGTDKLFGKTTGKLMESIRQAGIEPGQVDAVVMSHAHIDHCGGLMADDGSRNFPNATYYIGEPDYNYWTSDSKIPANYPARQHFLAQAQKNLVPNKDRIHFYKDHEEILPGVTALSAPGHTVSHTIFMINAGNNAQMCYIGDLAHHQVLLLEHPRTQFAYDTDPAQSAESRVRMLGMLASNRIPLIAYHFPWPGIGHVTTMGEGFVYHPQPMAMVM